MAPRYYSSNSLPMALAVPLGESGNPVVASLSPNLPSQYPFSVLIDYGTANLEVVSVNSAPLGTGPFTLPVTRGVDDTPAVTHLAGAGVVHGVSEQDFAAVWAEQARAEAAEASNAAAITAEVSRAESAEAGKASTSALTAEVSRAETAESTNAAAITTETSRAETAEGLAAQKANNLSDLGSASTARSNLGLGSAATSASSAFDAAGTASSAVATEVTRAETAEALLAPKASPTFTGTPVAPTNASSSDNTTQVATDAFVQAVASAIQSYNSGVYAPLISPALTGSPTAPTKTALTSNTDLATTAYADSAVGVETSRATTAEALKAAKASNLSDLASASTARTNLGLSSGATAAISATTSDIQRNGTQAAGSSGRLADAQHVHQEQADWLNVRDPAYGATGNGTTDDTTAVAAALSAANTASGGTVYFPAGTYKISAALTAYSNVTMVGSGATVSVIKQTSTTLNGIAGVSISGFRMQGLQLLGPGSGSGNGVSLTESGGVPNEYIHLSDVTVSSFGANGIQMAELIVSHFDNVISTLNGAKGIYIGMPTGTGATSCSFDACWANTNGTDGWHLQNMVYGSLQACASDANGVGYLIDLCQGVALNGCGAESTSITKGNGTSFEISGSNGITLNSCWSYLNNAVAFWCTAASTQVAFIGVVENGPGGSATASVKTDAGTSSTLVGAQVTTALSLAGTNGGFDNDGNLAVASNTYLNGDTYVYGGVFQTYAVATLEAGSNTAGSAPVLAPTISKNTGTQLSDTTRDYEVVMTVGTAGTAFVISIGSTSSANTATIHPSGTATAGASVTFRLPAGWFLLWNATTATIASTVAIGC